ncbi:DUF2283 domain-containing protein [Pseudanabaena mucicola]|uniref:DUF2283 domain-containing protein n=1 Tax=Pseudanabaena mucicola FACHB-723 TaxID=2692860 RepID=A0ABR7ZW55_9CYAN|nr:DUF2283 domain-containing protein [Pseudanabaena mucicola]MBD2187999.1 DUF2283 domain-containing protein [Pseudanabaena mucicola FACHB-723]
MKSAYDPTIDALYIRWTESKIAESDEVGGVILDYDEQGNVIGVEVLNASQKITGLTPKRELIGNLSVG